MGQLSNRITDMQESQTIAMAKKSRELKAAGRDIISLSLGEPDFETPNYIKEAAYKAIENNITHYPPVAGFPELRKAISDKFKRDNGLDYSPEQIVVSTGAKQSIINVVLSLVNPGDEVILPAPYWVSYYEMIRLAGGVPVVVETHIESDFKVTSSLLEKHINSKTKLMIFSSPCNPTGSVYTKEELADLATVIKKHPNFYVISDEIYELIQFGGKHESLAQFKDIYNQVVTINGVSKGFAMTGWRLGYIGAPQWIAKACDKIQSQFTSGTSTISQMAALEAIAQPPSKVQYMLEAFTKRRSLMIERLKEIPRLEVNEPEGAFYIFPKVSAFFGTAYENYKITSADDLCLYLLEKADVALVTGSAFGAPDYVRISYATSEQILEEACSRIEKALNNLQ